jgi:GDPmannose 4,6-dehydratase
LANYREAYGLFACSGLLFNHESPLRPRRFVTRKIVSAACRIALGNQEKLKLGNIAVKRDWGWAPEYVEAMWLMLQQDRPEDFVIATGETNKLEDFVDAVFSTLDLNWQEYVETSQELFRPTDLNIGRANPDKAARKLGWKARYRMQDVATMMVEPEMKAMKNECY